jgi:hypothetical protein
MARVESRGRRKSKASVLPFTKTNYQIIAVGLVLIVLGYVALSQEPWDGTMALVVAPVLLVLGYCVVIPFGILYRSTSERQANNTSASAEQQAAS